MCGLIRNMPDAAMLIVICGLGALEWALLVGALFFIDKLIRAWKASTLYRCFRLQQENSYLKQKIQEGHYYGKSKRRA